MVLLHWRGPLTRGLVLVPLSGYIIPTGCEFFFYITHEEVNCKNSQLELEGFEQLLATV
jgi:hypothetical protein